MPTSTSRLAYEDCFNFFSEALEDPRGIRILFAKRGDAKQLQVRMHSARVLDREENAETYDPSHPLFGRSEFDQVMVRLVGTVGEEETWIYIERRGANVLQIQRLSEVEEPLDVEYEEPQAIAASPLKLITFGEIERRD